MQTHRSVLLGRADDGLMPSSTIDRRVRHCFGRASSSRSPARSLPPLKSILRFGRRLTRSVDRRIYHREQFATCCVTQFSERTDTIRVRANWQLNYYLQRQLTATLSCDTLPVTHPEFHPSIPLPSRGVRGHFEGGTPFPLLKCLKTQYGWHCEVRTIFRPKMH